MGKIRRRLEVARKMPPLRHNFGGEFDPAKSEVIKWLISQPVILNYLFDAVRGKVYKDPYIVYDPETGKWQGVDYDND